MKTSRFKYREDGWGRMAAWLALLCLSIGAAACAGTGQSSTSPQFDYDALETRLERGRSTHADVRDALGEPTGSGSLLWPGDPEPRALWFYQKMGATTSDGQPDIQQDVLIVFFDDDLFDGFLWYSDGYRHR